MEIRKMKKSDIEILYNIAMKSFEIDFEKYGVYPPLINTTKKKFLPPILFGKTIIIEDKIIGGAFVVAIGKKGEIGAIFIEPSYQKRGLGKQLMLEIEKQYPKVKKWKLETPAESVGLHRFYESLGYVKVGEMKDNKSGMVGFKYEKEI